MSIVGYIVIGIIIALVGTRIWDHYWSFQAQRLHDYSSEAPFFDLTKVLGQRFTAHGAIFDYTGRANTRFTADIEGHFEGAAGRLSERFAYDGMDHIDTREWQIYLTGPATFTATAADIVGTASGEISGNSVRMTYRLRLPERAGGHVLDVVDWLYLMEDGTVINRSEMRKFGLRAAELFAVFYPVTAHELRAAAE